MKKDQRESLNWFQDQVYVKNLTFVSTPLMAESMRLKSEDSCCVSETLGMASNINIVYSM